VRVFFDTNVLVSAFLARGLCADLLRLVLAEHTLVSSEVVISELREVLSRKGKLPIAQIHAIETFLRDQPIAPRPEQTLELGLIDTDDEWVVASAVLIDACQVSRDRGRGCEERIEFCLSFLKAPDRHQAGGEHERKPGIFGRYALCASEQFVERCLTLSTLGQGLR